MTTTHALYCSTCGILRIGGPIEADDAYRFAAEHPETRGHRPRMITLDEARAILNVRYEQRRDRGGLDDPCLVEK